MHFRGGSDGNGPGIDCLEKWGDTRFFWDPPHKGEIEKITRKTCFSGFVRPDVAITWGGEF